MDPKVDFSSTGNKLLWTVPEFCQATGYSLGLVYRGIREGQIPSVVFGRTRRIPVAWAEAWIREQIQHHG